MKTDEKQIQTLATDLATYMQNSIVREVNKRTTAPKIYKNKFNSLLLELRNLKSDAEAILNTLKDDGLSYNSLEAEGYLRGLIQAFTIADDINNEDDNTYDY